MRMRPRRARRARAKRRLRESCVGESVSLAWHKMGWVGGRATRTSSVTIGILPVFWNRDCAVAISAGESRISTAGIVCRCFRITPTMRCAMFEKAKTTTSGHARYPPIYIPTYLHTYTCMHACMHTYIKSEPPIPESPRPIPARIRTPARRPVQPRSNNDRRLKRVGLWNAAGRIGA